MTQIMKEFIKDESGLGTIELVVLILVLIGLAVIFKDKITSFLTTLLGKFNSETTYNNFNPF